MIKAINNILPVFFAIGLLSCIKETEPECPPQYTVSVGVKDKNYTNTVSTNLIIDENLPFKSYVSTLYYLLKDINSGNIVSGDQNIVISDNSKNYTLVFNNIPNGSYKLTVWGNTTGSSVISKNDVLETIQLHPNNQEHTDIYMASDTLEITQNPRSSSLDLIRTKGLIQVTYKNLPVAVSQIDQRIDLVSQQVDNQLQYSGSTDFTNSFTVITQPQFISQTFTAPGAGNTNAKLYLTLLQAPLSPIIVPAIDLAVTRNNISPVEVDYDQLSGKLEIWTMIDGVWSKIHVMEIDDIN